jgi:hypothetical protein
MLVYLMAIRNILWTIGTYILGPFCNFVVIWYMFPFYISLFGIFHQEIYWQPWSSYGFYQYIFYLGMQSSVNYSTSNYCIIYLSSPRQKTMCQCSLYSTRCRFYIITFRRKNLQLIQYHPKFSD